ncbi:MAG: efflux RND transporter periplasmic adaptor subunit [Burkholderiales bacterium]|nr:efflux RND transporter periplasmic adaptor subunit [Burkholderiales bacterium]
MATTFARIAGAAALLGLGALAGWGYGQWQARQAPTVDGTAAPQATASAGERKVLYWYDPMVPTQRFDKPGKSPFMDMQLVPRYADEGEAQASAPGALTVSTQAKQALGLRLVRVEKRALGAAVEAVGTVQLNERDIAIVQARTAGFVERVFDRAPGDVITAGAPLAELLNPEWLGAQQEFLAVKAAGDAALAQAAKQRLVLLGMPAALVERVDATGQPLALQTITAPIGGVISELMVRQGMAVAPGMTLARINGLGTVWLEVALPEAMAAAIRPGQPVQARFLALPGEIVYGKVAAVLAEANREARTLRLRVELPNPGQKLKAGLFAQVSLRGAAHEALVVPAEAVIRTGRRALVYVSEQPGRYRPVPVEIGEQVDEWIVVRSGLAAGQQVVASGQFLIDSEASLQGVMARATAPAATAYHTTGVITQIEAGSITLDHAPVPELKWPAMSMPFLLADPALARGLKPGQTVSFSFDKQGDNYRVTAIAPQVEPADPHAGHAPAAAASGASR